MFTRIIVVLVAFTTILPQAFAATAPRTIASEPDPGVVKSALNQFNSLSKAEKKERIKEAKKFMRQYKAERKAGKEPLASKAVIVIVTILLPPLGVYLHEGEINSRFWISLLLTLLFYVPGLIYSLIIVLGE